MMTLDGLPFCFQAHWNMSMLQSEDLMKAAVAMISKDEEPPQFAKLWTLLSCRETKVSTQQQTKNKKTWKYIF